jgi:hypothetical protein
MDENFNWIADIILGSTDKIAPPVRPVPDVPLLDAIAEGDHLAKRELSKSAGAADDVCAQLDRDYLISELCPIPEQAQLERDVERFSLTKAAPGLDFVKQFVEEVLPTATALGDWTPRAHEMFGKLIKSGRTRQDISRIMTRHYSHGLWKRWEQMMDAFVGDPEFTEQKGVEFLKGVEAAA